MKRRDVVKVYGEREYADRRKLGAGHGRFAAHRATIDAVLDHVTDRLAEHDALVLRHHGVRWTYGEL